MQYNTKQCNTIPYSAMYCNTMQHIILYHVMSYNIIYFHPCQSFIDNSNLNFVCACVADIHGSVSRRKTSFPLRKISQFLTQFDGTLESEDVTSAEDTCSIQGMYHYTVRYRLEKCYSYKCLKTESSSCTRSPNDGMLIH